jgi:hypothetical protein
MGHNSGKRKHRRKNFSPPKLEDIKPHQSYGIINKFHGGAKRNMTLSIIEGGTLKEVKATLKGSLHHMKCRQKIIPGLYCIYEYDNVILIMTDAQKDTIPRTIREALDTSAPRDADVSTEAEPDAYFYPSDSESDDDMFEHDDDDEDDIDIDIDIDIDSI